MNKILFVIFTENASLGASMLAHEALVSGWTPDILFVPPGDKAVVQEYVQNLDPHMIAFSFKSFERKQALAIAASLKPWVQGKVIAGGIHPTLMPAEVLNSGLFDAVIVGDGMGVWEKVLQDYEQLGLNIIEGRRHPDSHRYTRYFHSSSQIDRMKKTETATVISAMGCPYSCTFCHSGSAKCFNFPLEGIVDYIIKLYADYGVSNLHFLDDLFAVNLKRLKRFRELLNRSGAKLSFSSQVSTRANTFTPEIAVELKALGVETVNFGIETVSPWLLEFLNKKQTVTDCYRAMENCKVNGLNSVVNLMFGLPLQTEADYNMTLEYVERAEPDSVNCFYYTPYPGTVLYHHCFDNGYLPQAYNRNSFDWFEPKTDGISDVQVRLNKVDYDLASAYVKKIQQVVSRDDELFKRVRKIDCYPWVLVGTTRHFYFKKLLAKLSAYPWDNCLGYIDIDEEAGFTLDEYKIPKYEPSKVPLWCATHAFLGSDYKVLKRYVERKFGSIPLVSISSFKASHSLKDIREMME